MSDTPWPRAMKGVGRDLTPQQQLACLLRITASEGWSDNIGGHITVMQECSDNFLVNPWGIWWERSVPPTSSWSTRRPGRSTAWDVTPAINIHRDPPPPPTPRSRAQPPLLRDAARHPRRGTAVAAPELRAFAGDIAVVDEYSGVVNSSRRAGVREQVGTSRGAPRNHGAIIVADGRKRRGSRRCSSACAA
jgi:hypothetical protein